MTARPELLVLAGPSGAGKTTIARRLVEEAPERFVLSVSATTRRPRPGERTGVEYDFVSREEFEAMIRAGALAEWAVVHGHYYGTPWRSLSALAEPNAGSAFGSGAIAVRAPGLAPPASSAARNRRRPGGRSWCSTSTSRVRGKWWRACGTL